MTRDKLTHDEAAARAGTLPQWALTDDHLHREWRFPDFGAAMAFVNRVASLAERVDHHPDISVSYSLVRLDLTTHSAGGLTERDFDLASEIDTLPATS